MNPTRDNANAPPVARVVRLFRNGANQAVRIPREFEFDTTEALVWRDGSRLVFEALPATLVKGRGDSLLAALAGLTSVNESFPDVDADLPGLDAVSL